MAAIVREGIAAGALGFSTSRTLAHRAIDGEPVPGTFAAEDELFGIGRVLGELGTGVFELAPAGALGRGPRRARAGDGLDAPAVRRHRAAGDVRAQPEQQRPRRVAADARPRGRRRGRGCARASAGARPHGVAAARVADVPPVQLLPGVGVDRRCCRGRSRWRASRDDPELRARLVHEATASRTTRSCRASCTRRGSSCSATRPTTSRRRAQRRGHRRSRSVDRSGSAARPACSTTAAASCSTRRSSTTPTATSTRHARCSCTRRPRSGSATVAPTPARPATRARPRSC